MALFTKQDFSPPLLSRKWLAVKFRPNMLLYNREHVISILESGLLFREDSASVEQEAPCPVSVWAAAGGCGGGWLTCGERVACGAVLAACVFICHPTSLQRSTLIYLSGYLTVPLAIRTFHRRLCKRTPLQSLLAMMRDYLTLARRAAACVKECAVLHGQIDSMSSVTQSTYKALCRQQSELSVLMSRASSALLGNVPWIHDDVAWDCLQTDHEDNLMKIHHAFLVVQSTLLKHVAMAHSIPSVHNQKIYKNHNERIHWIHNVLLKYLYEEFKLNYETLDRMYRLLKNYGNQDLNTKTPGVAINDRWLYSEVHTGVARACLELKLALSKCNKLDMFLDTCALNNQEFDLDILDRDLDSLIDGITVCLSTAQNSQIRLRKLQNKFVKEKPETIDNESDNEEILKIEDCEPETKDEVFYFVKTEDDSVIEPSGDVTTAPGQKEKETTKLMLNELKRKLVKREDTMRERERQALVKTMPELKNNLPEFPRQINVESLDHKGFIHKISKDPKKHKLFRKYKIRPRSKKPGKYTLNNNKYYSECEIDDHVYEANDKLNSKNKLLTVGKNIKEIVLTRWHKKSPNTIQEDFLSSEGLSDVEANATNKTVNLAVNVNQKQNGACNPKYTERNSDLELNSSDSDSYKEQQMALLHDIRRHRVTRKKNFPSKKVLSVEDEGLKPVEYSFGAGIAMASVLQVNGKARLPGMLNEEVFIGDGEVSNDSGNDEDA